ncbi:MAG: hypothetical protein CVV51_13840 [Spirochaetae bacterium HGW-Spirochaetae-7]|jgi:hypothetical protein|nr:MAG: hypothetical protein CVV51_13840 [Spirochaetae bacterium HGW-Spirochaetae-7]
MADPAGLSVAIGPIAALLVPVVAMLFVALRLRRRVRYPHGLLSPRDGRSPAALLFRTLRLYGDAVVDAACAVLIGLVIAGYPRPAPRRGRAVVLDASLSMLSGLRGDRPLDEATRLLFTDGSLRGSTLFTLGFDPSRGRPIMRDVTRQWKDSTNPQAFAAALESSEAFLSADFTIVTDLGRRGYGPITLVTDDQSVEGAGLDVLKLSARPAGYLYPASAAWDEAADRSVVRFVSAGGAAIMALWRVSDSGELSRAKSEDWTIASTPSGFELSFPEPGLWAVQWYGHVLPFEAPGRPGSLVAEGDFARRIVTALAPAAGNAPYAKEARSIRSAGSPVVRERTGADTPGSLSVARVERELYVMPPRLTLGEAVAAGLDREADLALGPAALSTKEAAIPFWLLRAASGEKAGVRESFARSRPWIRQKPVRVGDGYLSPGSGAAGPGFTIAPVGEYASTSRRSVIDAGSPPDRRFLVALALAALYALKLVIARRSRGSSPTTLHEPALREP